MEVLQKCEKRTVKWMKERKGKGEDNMDAQGIWEEKLLKRINKLKQKLKDKESNE